MQLFSLQTLHRFWQSLKKLSPSRQLFSLFSFLLIFLYPGQNQLQTLSLTPGPVISYTSPVLGVADYPQSDQVEVPTTSARAIVIQDQASRAILFGRNEDTQLLPASTTKLMTALIALDHYQLTDTLTVRTEDRAVGSSINLVSGETISVKSLLYGLLVGSGNDAALALADNYPGGYSSFVAAMNNKAAELHLDSTTFRNPSGVESYNHLTSARDLATLASAALDNPTIREIVATKNITVTDTTGNLVHRLDNTNELLGEIEGVQGLKTGWTERAGECLVTYVKREGRGVVIVVLGSLDRFGDTRRLIDWVYSHHTWVTPE